jgi:hypothetical protein
MAHGGPRINICYDCKHYIYVNRFSPDPFCPACGKPSEQTTKDKIRERFMVGGLYEFVFAFSSWQKIEEPTRDATHSPLTIHNSRS